MYRVVMASSAKEDVARIFTDLRERALDSGYPDEWFEQLYERVATLKDSPLRCGLAPESEYFEEQIRHLLVGNYRVLFTVLEKTVHVLHIRHGRQQVLRPGMTEQLE